MRRQLEHESRIARHAKAMHDEDAIRELHTRMDAQAEAVARLMHQTVREQSDSHQQSRAAAGSSSWLQWGPPAGAQHPGPRAAPVPAPEQGTESALGAVEVSAVRIACLTSMDSAIANARRANEKARLLAETQARERQGPRLAAAQAASRAAQRKKEEAAQALRRVAAAQAAREEAAAHAAVSAAQRFASDTISAAVEVAAEEEAARWAKQDTQRRTAEAVRVVASVSAAQVAEWEEKQRLAAAARALARERLLAASQYAKEEAALAADIARLRGQALARAVANRSKGRIRHQVAPKVSLFQENSEKLGRGDEALNAELARVAELWRRANAR